MSDNFNTTRPEPSWKFGSQSCSGIDLSTSFKLAQVAHQPQIMHSTGCEADLHRLWLQLEAICTFAG